MKTLYLLRHAKAEQGDAVIRDEDRALNERGREACEHIAGYMRRKGYSPQHVFCSPAKRTKETLALIAQGMGVELPTTYEKKLYLATAGDMLAQIHAADDTLNSLLLVGHNPGMHHLAALLTTNDFSALRHTLELKFPTGTLVVAEFAIDHWRSLQPDSGKLKDFVTPSEI